MQLILALPALFDDPAVEAVSTPAPALAQMIALAKAPERKSGGIAAALAAHHGVARQSDWPLAPIRLAALGVEPGNAYWLSADPVAVDIGLASAELAGIVDDLSRAEAAALMATLNAHFASDGLAFVAPRPESFFVRAATATRLTTVAARAALRRPLRALMPQGPDAAIWRRWQSEIEMLLHEHPVNVERRASGRTPIDSLWLSEGGTFARPPQPSSTSITFSASDIASALATFAGTPSRPLARDFRDALAQAGNVSSIVVVPDRTLDVASAERAWAAPARDALAAGTLDSMKLIGEDEGDAVVWHVVRPGVWQRIAGRFESHDFRALLDAARKPA